MKKLLLALVIAATTSAAVNAATVSSTLGACIHGPFTQVCTDNVTKKWCNSKGGYYWYANTSCSDHNQ